MSNFLDIDNLPDDFSGVVIVDYSPVSERMWDKGEQALVRDGQIRLSGCWFNFDNRYKVISNNWVQ